MTFDMDSTLIDTHIPDGWTLSSGIVEAKQHCFLASNSCPLSSINSAPLRYFPCSLGLLIQMKWLHIHPIENGFGLDFAGSGIGEDFKKKGFTIC